MDDPRFLANWELQKVFVQLVVKRAWVNLETGRFRVETKFENSLEWRQLYGQVCSPDAEEENYTMTSSAQPRSPRS